MQRMSIIDDFNLRFFINTVVEFTRQNDDSSIKTTLDFLESLFFGIGESKDDKKSKPVYDAQKVLTGNIAPDKFAYVLNDIDKIYENCKLIADQIEAIPNYEVFLKKLVSAANSKFFDEYEISALRTTLLSHSEDATQKLIFLFTNHGLRNLNRIPAQLAQSLYSEAQTYDYNQALRFSLLKAAADCGSKEAALEYGNYVNRTRNRALTNSEIEEAFSYSLKAVSMDAGLWNLAYLLEQHCLSKNQVDLLESTVKIDTKLEKLSDFERKELNSVICTLEDEEKKKSFKLAYTINFFLGTKGFSKSFNSLAKYLSLETYCFQLIDTERFQNKDDLIEYYYRKAIAGGNILAMNNLARKIQKKQPEPFSDEFLFAENLLETAVSMGMHSSYEALGLLHLDAGQTDQAKQYLQYALDFGQHKGLVLYKLGLIEPNLDEKVRLFLTAIREGYTDAAIDYALCENNLFQLDGKKIHLRNAINILQQYTLSARSEKRASFVVLQNDLEEILEKVETDR